MQKPQLTDEQMGIVREKQVKLNRPLAETIAFLAPLAKWDAAAGTARSRIGCGAALVLVAAIVSLVLAGNFGKLLGVFAVLLLILGIGLIVLWSKKKKEDLSDNLRVTAIPFLAALREDFGAEPVALNLDLRLPLSKEKQTGVQSNGSGLRKDVLTTYVDPWMSGEGLLTDGSRLQWSVVDTYHERKRWKKGSSGKYKQKTKTKKKTEVDVTVTLKMKRYDVGSFDAADVKHGENKNVVRISHKIARADALPTPHDEILKAIAGIFRELRPAQ